jgi:hypothetical protein
MQILFVLAVVALVIFVVLMVMAVIAALLMTAAVALGIGIPAYLLFKWWKGSQTPVLAQRPLERLQNLYVEGKIDIFEFERQVASLIAVER